MGHRNMHFKIFQYIIPSIKIFIIATYETLMICQEQVKCFTYTHSPLIFQQPKEEDSINIYILQMRTLKVRKINDLIQTAN